MKERAEMVKTCDGGIVRGEEMVERFVFARWMEGRFIGKV